MVQESLAGAWLRWEALVAHGTQEAYVRRSIANSAVSRWRRLRRTVVMADPPSPETPLDPDAQDRDAAWALCALLPPAQRAAVVLRFYEDLSYAEIAAVLECAEATVVLSS